MHLPRLLTGTAIVVVLSGTAACGLQSVEPRIELRDAASAVSSAGAGGMRFSIGSSAAEFRTFSHEADRESAATASGDDLSDADLNTLLASHADVSYDTGSGTSPADDSSQLSLHIGATDAGQLRVVNQTLYLRANVSGLVTEFPDLKDGVGSFAQVSRAGPTPVGRRPRSPPPPPPCSTADGSPWTCTPVPGSTSS